MRYLTCNQHRGGEGSSESTVNLIGGLLIYCGWRSFATLAGDRKERLLFKHKRPLAERESSFYGDLQQELFAHLRRGRKLADGPEEAAAALSVSPLDSYTGVDIVEVASHSTAALLAAMQQHPGEVLD